MINSKAAYDRPRRELRVTDNLLESPNDETFVEEWEYHEIAAAKAIPIGTVQWRVFNAKKKLAANLRAPQLFRSQAA